VEMVVLVLVGNKIINAYLNFILRFGGSLKN